MNHISLTPAAPLYFESGGKIVRLLGRESISNPDIAILEMIKNAWDADATSVEIIFENLLSGRGQMIIRDNGEGMTLVEIKDNWMIAATDSREKYPITKKFGRPRIGEKGIARFGLENLSGRLVVISKPAGKTIGYQIVFDWIEYEKTDAKFEKVQNQCSTFSKRKDEHGFECILSPLREKWDENNLAKLAMEIQSVVPPVSKPQHFEVKLTVPEYPQVHGIGLESKFLKKAVYICHSELKEDGIIIHDFFIGKKRKSRLKLKDLSYVCGPLTFDFYFFLQDMGRYETAKKTGIYSGNLDFSITELKEFLQLWGGIKIYRDDFRVKPYGDPGNDWLGLDRLRLDKLGTYPENEQVLGYIQITKQDNPRLIDTTTREGMVDDKAFQDLVKFVRESIKFFGQVRTTIKEQEMGDRAKRKKKVKRRPPKVPVEITPLLTFWAKYPDPFSKRLEEEINESYKHGLPNATLILSRKMVENLVYNILQTKFGDARPEMWWDEKNKRRLGFGPLLGNLADTRGEFKRDQPQLIAKFLDLVNPFLREANKKAHYIIEYLESVDDIENLKIPEIIQLLLDIRSRLQTKSIR